MEEDAKIISLPAKKVKKMYKILLVSCKKVGKELVVTRTSPEEREEKRNNCV